MKQILVEDINIEVVRKNIKHVYLRIYPPEGKVKISAPFRVNDDKVYQFVVSKLAWIKKQQQKVQQRKKYFPKKYIQNEEHFFKGRKLLLQITEINIPPKVILKDNRYINIFIRPHTPLDKIDEIMTGWYREQFRKQVPPLLDKWEKILGLKVKEWRIKQMKSTWGSCNFKEKRIWLNLELVKKPERCLEYIIVHELLHLKEKYHNKRFYTLLDAYLPDWKELNKKLNGN
ncbi:MAG: M48 family metallopeptidase [bacterium]